MRHVVSAILLLLVCRIAAAQGHFGHTRISSADDDRRGSPCSKDFAPAVDDPELQKVDWTVIGGTAQAQKFFRQGMTQYYAFNYEEALRCFRAAKVLATDPANPMPMASWGIALAAGPNINIDMDDPCHKLAYDESWEAYKTDQLRKARGDRNEFALENELIGALVLRYTKPDDKKPENARKALEAYSKRMAAVWNDFKSINANVSALYAESMIELQPWALYTAEGEPVGQATHIVDVLKQGIELDARAVGANHYFIHAIEGSKDPGRADDSAKLLDTLVLPAGHLVHMPSHIYLLKGEYEKALVSNLNASEVDRKEYAVPCGGSYAQYSINKECPQLYYGHYLTHNLFFGTVSATFRGQSHVALTLARETRAHVENFVVNEPGLQRYMTAPLMTLVMNRSWWAILAEPEPPASCYIQPPFTKTTGCSILRSMWYWARGMAHASRGEVTAADNDFLGMTHEMAQIDPLGPIQWGNNPAATVLAIATSMLKARIAWAKGERPAAIGHLVDAVAAEDLLKYDEPPQWFAPAREALGGAYLQTGDFGNAKKIFDAELHRHPNSGRALYGLLRALKGLALPCEAVEKQFCEAWKDAEYTMTVEDLWPARNVDSRNCGIETVCPPKG